MTFLFLENAYYKVNGLQVQLQYIAIALNCGYNKNKLYETLDY